MPQKPNNTARAGRQQARTAYLDRQAKNPALRHAWQALNHHPWCAVLIMVWGLLPLLARFCAIQTGATLFYRMDSFLLPITWVCLPYWLYVLVQSALTPRVPLRNRLINRSLPAYLVGLLIAAVAGGAVYLGLSLGFEVWMFYTDSLLPWFFAPLCVAAVVAIGVLLAAPALGGAVLGEVKFTACMARRKVRHRALSWQWLAGGIVFVFWFIGLSALPAVYATLTGNSLPDTAGSVIDLFTLPIVYLGLYFGCLLCTCAMQRPVVEGE